METNSNRIKAIIGTILFHTLVALLFIFYGLTTPLPLPEEQGVEVNLGNSDQGMGTIQKEISDQSTHKTPPVTNNSENIQTSNNEESINIDKKENTNNIVNKNTTITEKIEPVIDMNALYKGKNKTIGNNEGITNQPGDQGNPNGNPNANNYDGNPGGGNNGISYSLAGRTKKHIPIPEYNSLDQGRVVVSITVNRNGEVTKAVAGAKGTTTSSQTLWSLAEKAALKAKFDAKLDAPEEQKGTITYNFIRLN